MSDIEVKAIPFPPALVSLLEKITTQAQGEINTAIAATRRDLKVPIQWGIDGANSQFVAPATATPAPVPDISVVN